MSSDPPIKTETAAALSEARGFLAQARADLAVATAIAEHSDSGRTHEAEAAIERALIAAGEAAGAFGRARHAQSPPWEGGVFEGDNPIGNKRANRTSR